MDNLIIDCFAGGGGASVGIEMALGRPVDIAVNHDPEAIRMHKVNHPDTLHLTEDIFKADLKKIVNGRRVALMWASPDCTSHSKAKGGQPRNSGLRILPWAVFKHAREILPEVIIMENVEEIQQWGPLDSKGHPIPERRGEDYKRFIKAMCALGYRFDSREKDRFGLANVVLEIEGEQYILKDIFLRMLKPEELKLMQGFPKDYIINRDIEGKPYPIKEQVARIGNSVVPIMAEALVRENCGYLKVGERLPNLLIDESEPQLKFA